MRFREGLNILPPLECGQYLDYPKDNISISKKAMTSKHG
jgi:hypothetical protein